MGTIEENLKELVKNYSERDKRIILEAFSFAESAHEGQKRFSGEDYIIHPLRSALILAHLKLDAPTVAAALLHDVLDDTKVLALELEKKFSREIAFLAKGVSRLGKLRLPKQNLEIEPIEKISGRPANLEIENLRRMFFAMAEDVRVILIKLADRVHNMETLQFIPKEKQKRFALETMEIFVPLANRLGIKTVRTKLENLAFPYLYPKEYQWLLDNAQERHDQARHYLDRAREILKKRLSQEKIECLEIQGRLKAFFSLYCKLLRHGLDFDRVYDLAALRIIVKDVKGCYEVLGAIHKYWRPLPGRIKDYIAFPKPNCYQSLHTTVFCEQGKIIEVQIRTPEMNEQAEHGICSHWALKEGVDLKKEDGRFGWIQQLANWQKETANQKEYLEGLKIDFFKNRIFVFTPKGDIIDLPEGATPIDFAYAVHSQVGYHCASAKASGKIIPLSAALKNGEVVEILLDKNKKPSTDWLKIAKTNLAKTHIKKQLEGLNPFRGLQEFKEKVFQIRLPRPQLPVLAPARPKISPVVTIAGKTQVAYDLAKCCQPQLGQAIAAYLARIKGRVVVHLQTCENLKRLKEKFPEKILGAEWQ